MGPRAIDAMALGSGLRSSSERFGYVLLYLRHHAGSGWEFRTVARCPSINRVRRTTSPPGNSGEARTSRKQTHSNIWLPTAAKPRVVERAKRVVTSSYPTFAGRDATWCRL